MNPAWDLDNLTSPELAREMRDGLRNLYSVIKGQDARIKFAMLTGVSKFSKVNIFSGLNNLWDITLNAEYSNICGHTVSSRSRRRAWAVESPRPPVAATAGKVPVARG